MEALWWLFVFVAWAVWLTREGEEMPVTTWYIIGLKWYENGSLQLREIDAIECECKIDAEIYAKMRYRPGFNQELYTEACLTTQHIKRAKQLSNQHRLDDQVNNWTDEDWRELEALPTYSGDQDKYTKTQAS